MLGRVETLLEDHSSRMCRLNYAEPWTWLTATALPSIIQGSMLQKNAWFLLLHMLAAIICNGLPQACGCLDSVIAALASCW